MPLFSKGGNGGRASLSLPSNMLAPRQLFQQILLMQSIYYFIGFVLILFTCMVSGDPFTLATVFSWEPVRVDTTMGWTLFLLWLLDTFFSVLALTVVVGRSKLALDFTLTLHGIHLVVCWIVSGKFPASKLWWGLQVVSILFMVLLGTWTTQWRELRATFFDTSASERVLPSHELNSSSRHVAPVSQDQYDEFELQDGLVPNKSTSKSNGLDTATNKALDKLQDEFDSDEEGDITAGSKLMRDTGRMY